jgi:hypothetical protein
MEPEGSLPHSQEPATCLPPSNTFDKFSEYQIVLVDSSGPDDKIVSSFLCTSDFYGLRHKENVALHIGMELSHQLTNKMYLFVCVII